MTLSTADYVSALQVQRDVLASHSSSFRRATGEALAMLCGGRSADFDHQTFCARRTVMGRWALPHLEQTAQLLDRAAGADASLRHSARLWDRRAQVLSRLARIDPCGRTGDLSYQSELLDHFDELDYDLWLRSRQAPLEQSPDGRLNRPFALLRAAMTKHLPSGPIEPLPFAHYARHEHHILIEINNIPELSWILPPRVETSACGTTITIQCEPLLEIDVDGGLPLDNTARLRLRVDRVPEPIFDLTSRRTAVEADPGPLPAAIIDASTGRFLVPDR